jgi:type I restriction enzyme S subunit
VDCEHKTAPPDPLGEYRCPGTRDIKNGRLLLDNAKRVNEQSYQEWTARLVPERDDLVLAREAPVGEVGIVPPDCRVCLGQRTVLLRPNPKRVVPRYLLYLLLTPEMRHEMVSRSEGSTVAHLNMSDIRALQIPIEHELDEQLDIAEALGALDARAELNARIGATLEGIAQATFEARFLEFAEVETPVESDIGPIPAGWRVVPLSEAVEINPKVPGLTKGREAPFIEMAAVLPWATRPSVLAHRPFSGSGARFAPGDVLMARITGCIENGKGAFIDFLDEPGFGSTEFLVFRAKEPLTPEAVFFLTRADFVRAHAISHMTGSSGRQRVPVDSFDHIQVAIPPDLDTWSGDAEVMHDCLLMLLFDGTLSLPLDGGGAALLAA